MISPEPAATKSAAKEADELVDQLVENAASYRATLPSLTAHETIASDASIMFYKPHAEAEATVRMVRNKPGGPLVESRQFTMLNGKPVAPDKNVVLPTNIYGDFDDHQSTFFSTQHRRCFNFTLTPQPTQGNSLELLIALSPDAAGLSACSSHMEGITGIARVDPATHQLTHLEWKIPQVAAPRIQVLFASTDYAPVSFSGKTFWLPTAVVEYAINGKTKAKGHFVVHYSDYHQFTSSITVLPTTPN